MEELFADTIHIVRSRNDISYETFLKAELVFRIDYDLSNEILKDRFDALEDTKGYDKLLSDKQLTLLYNIAERLIDKDIELTTTEKYTLCYVIYNGYYRNAHRHDLLSLRKKYINYIKK